MKRIIPIITIILLLSSAYALYSGETATIESGLDNIIKWWIINNNTIINATQNSNSTISITISQDADNLTFSIIFQGYKNEEERVITNTVTHHSGGGYVYRNITQNNTIYLYPNNQTNQNQTQVIEETENKANRYFWWVILLSVIATILLLTLIYLYIKRIKFFNSLE